MRITANKDKAHRAMVKKRDMDHHLVFMKRGIPPVEVGYVIMNGPPPYTEVELEAAHKEFEEKNEVGNWRDLADHTREQSHDAG